MPKLAHWEPLCKSCTKLEILRCGGDENRADVTLELLGTIVKKELLIFGLSNRGTEETKRQRRKTVLNCPKLLSLTSGPITSNNLGSL